MTTSSAGDSGQHPPEDPLARFPHILVLRASAGSGKTHELTKRFVTFLIADLPTKKDLRNILAITFSNNAALEMRQRILEWLKALTLGREKEMSEFADLGIPTEEIRRRAASFLADVLARYTDLQVKTIDSFMTGVFKASAIDLGYDPDFEILLDNRQLMKYAFDLYLRRIRKGSAEARLFEGIVDYLGEYRSGDASYHWDPTPALLDELSEIHRRLSASGKPALIENRALEMKDLQERIGAAVAGIEAAVADSGLERNNSSAYHRSCLNRLVQEGRFTELIGKGLAIAPVKKPGKGKGHLDAAYERITGMWGDFGDLAARYAESYSRSFYYPYLRAYEEFSATLEMSKKRQEKVFIEDINRLLVGYLEESVVPDIYFRIGETIYHYLIDEFQDTSPVQWKNLFPLIENSLAQRGSLLVVGDTKQAIYGFRDADYTIMRELEAVNPFRSAERLVRELDTNYRSLGRILDFSEQVFKQNVRKNELYADAGKRSGLVDYTQRAKESDDQGYAGVIVYDRDEALPEREMICRTISDMVRRGFGYGDIAVLTQRNDDAVMVSGWLNEQGIRFISYSNLDIRRRKITAEIISLLGFLDSPIDDHAFSAFILGDIFARTLAERSPETTAESLRDMIFNRPGREPLYKTFQRAHPGLWEECFSRLFRVSGYFPIYDLVSEAYNAFDVFNRCAEDEAALVKILEVIMEFEGAGYNSLREFLDFAEDEESDSSAWNMDAPKGTDAVRVMTIHKAKGLGFPAVIVLLTGAQRAGYGHILEEQKNGVALLKITKGIIASCPGLGELYEEAALKDLVNRLNSLYVGFTRPREELHVIGVKGKKEYPFDLLPLDEFPAAAVTRTHAGKPETRPSCRLSHAHHPFDMRALLPARLGIAERKRGEFIHRVLALIEYEDCDMEELLRKAQKVAGFDAPSEGVAEAVRTLLEHPGVRPFFQRKPGRTVLREQEFVDSEGRLCRIDRIVADTGHVTVIEFKTGADTEHEERHESQVRNYLGIVREVFRPRAAEGVLVYVDLANVKTVA